MEICRRRTSKLASLHLTISGIELPAAGKWAYCRGKSPRDAYRNFALATLSENRTHDVCVIS
jgi:hypothetical protein